jgi:hypothetical protein
VADPPNPMILPPCVDVVLIQDSTANESGPTIGFELLTRPFGVPLNVDAALVSALMAPVAPRLTPAPAVPSFQPDQS